MAKDPQGARYLSRVDAIATGLVEVPPTPEPPAELSVREPRQTNPYFRALVVLTIIFAVISALGWIVVLVGEVNTDLELAAGASVVASFALYLSLVFLIATLVTGAITWQVRKSDR